jgi:Flp pilus assembly pilin Flp
MKNTFRNLLSAPDETGQTMAEYGVLIAGIALVLVLALPIFGAAVGDLFRGVVSAFGG